VKTDIKDLDWFRSLVLPVITHASCKSTLTTEYYEAPASINSIDEAEDRGEALQILNPMNLDSSRLDHQTYSPCANTGGEVTV
jgi:hypothetical protein